MGVFSKQPPVSPPRATEGLDQGDVDSMIVTITLADRLIAAYVQGFIERYIELKGYEPHQDDIEEVTQEAIRLYS